VEYFAFMINEWGLNTVNMFRELKNTTIQYKEFHFREIEQKYKDKTAALLTGES
jgi:hypothetical protein